MSHFSVLVVGPNYEEQLAPFQENNMEDCPQEYLEFISMESTYKQEYENDSQEVYIKKPSIGWHPPKEVRIHETIGAIIYPYEWKKLGEPSDWEKIELPWNEQYPSLEKYAKEWHGNDKRDEQKGEFGYWENPRRKWDWYQLGGRWSGYFKMLPNGIGSLGESGVMDSKKNDGPGWADQAMIKHIDFEFMSEANRKEAKKYFNNPEGFKKWSIKKDDASMTEEKYIESMASWSTFALLKDGQWYERGSMGWWGMVADEKEESVWEKEFSKMINTLPGDTILSLVDCHI